MNEEPTYIDCTPDYETLRTIFMAEWQNGERRLKKARNRLAELWSIELSANEEADERRWAYEEEANAAIICADAARMLLALHGIVTD